ncbi:MAG: hypothetical protein JSR82_08450 [Verrucomicrobia bacterium]|nr:hypothetical protein [Verrucomicrobiota bacterium]
MTSLRELRRLTSPAPLPQSLAFAGDTLWLGSRGTHRIYELDAASLQVRSEWPCLGTPWGLTWLGEELRVVCSDGDDMEGERVLLRFLPGQGFDPNFRFPCPEDAGSQLSFDGQTVFLSQWYKQRLVALDAECRIVRELPVPHQICGQVFAQGAFHLVTTDDEDHGDYWLTRLDPATGRTEDLAVIPFAARALAHDGRHFWTNHRAQHELVCFEI